MSWRVSQPLGTADEKSEARDAAIAKFAQGAGKIRAAQLLAFAIEANQFVRSRNLADHDHGFGGHAGGWRGPPGFRHLDHRHGRKRKLAAGGLGTTKIVPAEVAFGPLLQLAYGNNQ